MNDLCSNPHVSIIIPSFKGYSLFRETWPTLLESLSKVPFPVQIIIIDNGPPDGTEEYLKAHQYPHLRYDCYPTPLGFSKACNIGALKAEAPYLFFMNNDIKTRGDFLSPLLRLLESRTDAFAVGPKFLRWDEKTLDDGVRELLFDRGLLETVLQNQDLDKVQSMTLLLGGGFLVRKDRFWELEGFDEIYTPFAWEDLDLGYKACKRGYRHYYCPDAVLYHKREATTRPLFRETKFKALVWRNKFIFMWSLLTDYRILLEHFISLPVKLIKFTFNGRWPYVIGFFLALLKIFSILRKRAKEKPFIKCKDTDLLKIGKTYFFKMK